MLQHGLNYSDQLHDTKITLIKIVVFQTSKRRSEEKSTTYTVRLSVINDFPIFYFSGCSDYDGLRIELYRDTDLFLVCFDIGNSDSLDVAIDNVSFFHILLKIEIIEACRVMWCNQVLREYGQKPL